MGTIKDITEHLSKRAQIKSIKGIGEKRAEEVMTGNVITLKRVLVKSVYEIFSYVMQHYYPSGMTAEAAKQCSLTDIYAVVSIQDIHTQGFVVQF